MAKTVDLRTYLLLERAFVRRLQRTWRLQSAPTYAKITQACLDHKWDEARRLVPDLDMTEVGTENREWITYMLLSCAVFGANTVAKGKPSFVGVGSFDTFLKQVTNNLLQYLEFGATAKVQEDALHSIAMDEARTKALPKVAYDPGQARDAHGRWTEAGPLVAYHGTVEKRLESILREGLTRAHAGEAWKAFSRTDRVYVTTSEQDGKNWAENSKHRHEDIDDLRREEQLATASPLDMLAERPEPRVTSEVAVLLTVEIPASEVGKLEEDRYFPGETKRTFDGDIKPEWITRAQVLKEGDRVGGNWEDVPLRKKIARDGTTIYIALLLSDDEVTKWDEHQHPRDKEGQFTEAVAAKVAEAAKVIADAKTDGRPVLFHSGDASIDAHLAQGIEPRFGGWLEEVLSGATDDDELADQIREQDPVTFFSTEPDWVAMKVARAMGKFVGDVTLEDIRTHGQLSIISVAARDPSERFTEAEQDAFTEEEWKHQERLTEKGADPDDFLTVGGKHHEEIIPLGGTSRGFEEIPFGVEPKDIFSKSTIVPDVTLTGDALVAFLQIHYPHLLAHVKKWDEQKHPRDKEGQFVEAADTVLTSSYDGYQHMIEMKTPDGHLIGHAKLRMTSRDLAEYDILHIDPKFRGHGYGEHLYRAIADKARRLGAKRILGDVTSAGVLRLGIKVLGTPEFIADAIEEYTLEQALKKLEPQAPENAEGVIDTANYLAVRWPLRKQKYAIKWDEARHPRDKQGQFAHGGITEVTGVDWESFYWGKDFREPDDYYYHVTLAPHAQRIVENQELTPGRAQFMGRAEPAAHSKGNVFLTDRNGVYFWASRVQDHAMDQYDDPPKVAVVRIPKRLVPDVSPDPAGTRDANAPAYIVKGPLSLKWDEQKHPRDKQGQFTESGGDVAAEEEIWPIEGGGPERKKWNKLLVVAKDADAVIEGLVNAQTQLYLRLKEKYQVHTPEGLAAYLKDPEWVEADAKREAAQKVVDAAYEVLNKQAPAMRKEVVTNLAADVAKRLGIDPSVIHVVDKEPREFSVGDKQFKEGGHYDPRDLQIEINARNIGYNNAPGVKGVVAHEISHLIYHQLKKTAEQEFTRYTDLAITPDGQGYTDWYKERFETVPGLLYQKQLKSEYRAEFAKMFPASAVIAGLSDGDFFKGLSNFMIKENGHSAYAKSYWDEQAVKNRGYEPAVNETIAEVTRFLSYPKSWQEDHQPDMHSPWVILTGKMHAWYRKKQDQAQAELDANLKALKEHQRQEAIQMELEAEQERRARREHHP